ncbi:Uncharacterised protein [Mycobacteroides abscessus subsp. massiliense]|nr:Uncharacterised protein [Mycobacteroides abscessus subsp. massiliense]
MRENPTGQRDPGRHQEGGPVHGVEPDDVLADHVDVGGPVPPEQLRIGIRVTDPRQVVGQRVHPHVHDMFRVVGDRHSPVEGGP